MPLKIFTSKFFFGRESELERLHEVASKAQGGDASSVFLSGRLGVGKTEILRQLFNRLFWAREGVIPFFYTINKAFVSIEDFSRDYLSKFILQALAFLKREPSLVNATFYPLNDLLDLVRDSEAQWTMEIINNYLRLRKSKDMESLFLSAISAPYRSYLNTRTPVVVMIDDFHKIKDLCNFDGERYKNLWMLFENSALSPYTPHIFTGFQTELQDMFFEETTLGEHLEIIELSNLDRDTAIKFLKSMCEIYDLKLEIEMSDFIDLFNGNPLYIKSFVQTARGVGKNLKGEEILKVYINEITNGKIYKYWIHRLRTYIPQIELRESSLRFLYHLCNGAEVRFSNLLEQAAVKEEVHEIINLLQKAGIIEAGFSTFKLIEDEILGDIIRILYHREILKEPLNRIQDLIIKDKAQRLKVELPIFEITTPSTPGAELMAIKALEQVAQYHNIPSETVGQLQMAATGIFANIIKQVNSSVQKRHFKFKLEKNIFSIEITVPATLVETENQQALESIKKYLDEIKIERVMNNVRITMLKILTSKGDKSF